MNLQKIFKSAKYKIVGGGPFLWNCFGPNAYYMDFGSNSIAIVNSGYNEVSVRFDTKTQVVYSIEVYITVNRQIDVAFSWINPDYREAYVAEHIQRNCEYGVAYDDVHFIEKENETEILEIISAAINEEDVSRYVKTCLIDLEFSKKDLFKLMRKAHKRDITLNQLLIEMMEDAVEYAKEIVGESEKQDAIVFNDVDRDVVSVNDSDDSEPSLRWMSNGNFVANGKIYTHQYCVETDWTRLIDEYGNVEFEINATNDLFKIDIDGDRYRYGGFFIYHTGGKDFWALNIPSTGTTLHSKCTDIMKAELELLKRLIS